MMGNWLPRFATFYTYTSDLRERGAVGWTLQINWGSAVIELTFALVDEDACAERGL
jgi:hypothetical protein